MFPPNWFFRGPRKARDVKKLFTSGQNVGGDHVSDVWRIVRIGPWSFWMLRYKEGLVGDEVQD